MANLNYSTGSMYDPSQAGYDAGYRAGFDAGYQAGLRAVPSHAGQPHQFNQPDSHSVQLPSRPPPVPPRPNLPVESDHKARPNIWQPIVGLSWQLVLGHPVQLNNSSFPISQAEVWDVDLFDTPAETVAHLHAMGRKVIAYFSAGSYEDWRSDASTFPKSDLGRHMDGWEGEKWLQTNSPAIQDIMRKRMDLAVTKGFDGVDPDNVDGYDNKNGIGLTKKDAMDYMLFLSHEAHIRGLSIGLKNGGDIARGLVDHVEFCVQEQAVQYNDEKAFEIFLQKGKPIFHVEYPKGDDPDNKKQNDGRRVEGKKKEKALCLKSKGWSSIIKNVKLDQWVQMD